MKQFSTPSHEPTGEPSVKSHILDNYSDYRELMIQGKENKVKEALNKEVERVYGSYSEQFKELMKEEAWKEFKAMYDSEKELEGLSQEIMVSQRSEKTV